MLKKIQRSFLLINILFISMLMPLQKSFAQNTEDSVETQSTADVDQIEAELESKIKKNKVEEIVPEKESKLTDFSGLGKLAPFSEISVLQKRFLPKTGRFQAFLGFTNVVNDPWFLGLGLHAKLGYHFNETWSIEGTGIFLNNSQRRATKDLYDEHRVKADSIITAKSYTGAALVWTPIYGKISYGNKRIFPFDMYFSLGAGSTGVDGGAAGSTLSASTGQIYALSKGMGFRWDFTWNNFTAKPQGANPQGFNSLLLTFGASFFFPEAKYR